MRKSGARKKKNASQAPSAPAPVAAGATAAATPPSKPRHATPSNGVVEVDASLLLKRAHELKEEGNRLFQEKDYVGALGKYEMALKLTPHSHPDRAVFHSNRAACLMQMRPVDHEAVTAECSLALRAQPGFPRALLRRARALEALRRYDLALQDVHALLAQDSSHPDALDLARRLRAAAAAAPTSPSAVDPRSRPSPAALGASVVQVGIPVSGLGTCLPARPKKASTPPQPSPTASKPAVPSQNHHLPSSPSLPNGPQTKSQPLRLVPSKLPNGETPSQSSQIVSPRGSSRLSVKKKTLEAAVIRWRPLKLVYDHDIRLAQMPANCTFKALREIVTNIFPSSKSVLIKYKDPDGDLITVTSTAELKLAESCVDEINKKEVEEGSGVDKDDKLQLLRLQIVEVNPDQEPQVPEEEEKLLEEEGMNIDQSVSDSVNGDSIEEIVNKEVIKMGPEAEEVAKDKVGVLHKGCDHPGCKEVEIDDWLFEFAQLFRNQIGIDAEAHLDLHELGIELCSEALEETVTGEEAQCLFDLAAAKFQEVAALALFNWGNVHMCAARKHIPLDESAPKDVLVTQLQTAYDWVSERYALAGKKYEEALKIKPDFYEGLLALGQQEFETAKLHWSFALAKKLDLSTWDSSETIRLFDGAEEKMKAATNTWEKVEQQRINELKDLGKSKEEEEELLKKRTKQRAADGHGELSAEETAEQAAAMRSQIHLFWGNMLFERSQVEFKLGFGNWKKNLDAAIERFKLAGASEGDISTVLEKHASNETDAQCDEKKITISNSEVSEVNSKDEDKHMLEN